MDFIISPFNHLLSVISPHPSEKLENKKKKKKKKKKNGGINVYINNLGHMTKMAAMPIYGKNPSKIFFSRTGGSISMNICMKHRWLKYTNVYINHDPVMTLTYFTARST